MATSITTHEEFDAARAECVRRGKLSEYNQLDRFCTATRMCGHHTAIAYEFIALEGKRQIAQANANRTVLDGLTLEEKLEASITIAKLRKKGAA